MSRGFKARDKKINKMTRDGLVERNAVTGEETRISKQEQSFDLRREPKAKERFQQKQEPTQKLSQKKNRKQKRLQREQSKLESSTRNNNVDQLGSSTRNDNAGQLENSTRHDNTDQLGNSIRNDNAERLENSTKNGNAVKLESSDRYKTVSVKSAEPILKPYESGVVDNFDILQTSNVAISQHESKEQLVSESRSPTTSDIKPLQKGTKYQQRFVEPSQTIKPIESASHTTESPADVPKTTGYTVERVSHLKFDKEQLPLISEKKPTKKQKDIYRSKATHTVETSADFSDKKPLEESKESAVTFSDDKKKPVQSNPDAETTDVPIAEQKKSTLQFSSDSKKPVQAHADKKATEVPITKKKEPVLQFSADEKKPIKAQNNKTSAEASTNEKPVEVPTDKKLTKLKEKSEMATEKLEKAKSRLPTKKKVRLERVFNESKQKPELKLKFEKEVIPQGSKGKRLPKPVAVVKTGVSTLKYEALHKIHSKISEVEHENVAVHATHKGEQVVENFVRSKHITRSAFSFVKNSPYRKVTKLEKKASKANIKFAYKKALSENPQLRSNPLSRLMQKQKIKKQYAVAARQAKKTTQAVQQTASFTTKVTKAIVGFVSRHPIGVGCIALVLLFFFAITSMMTTFSTVAVGGLAPFLASSYTANDTDIDKTELAYTEWETDLVMQAWNAANSHSGYDEYRYNIGDISHNPYELMAFMTAKYQGFTYAAIEADLQQIFNEQYRLTFTESVETRYDPDTGDPYDWHVLNVGITTRSFTDVIFPLLNSDERQLFNLFMQTKGNRQYIDSPFDFNWIPNVSSYYGWRIHPVTGAKDYHKGVDIAVPIGTDIHAGLDGVVTAASYDDSYGYYVVVENSNGVQAKYAHCDTLLVNVGQEVKKGDIIAKSGNTGNSTGAHLHLEVLKNGEYLNPLYFAITNDTGGGPVYGDPGTPMGDGSYAALIAEGERYLGYPYVWGGSSPSTSFDCSGFICWVLNHSGVASIGRTTAQGIYNQCTPVSPSDARPGDLIFFTGTYSTTSPVTHIGIYVGNGQMLHCGNPIQYTSVNTSYWQNHFYAFGRIN